MDGKGSCYSSSSHAAASIGNDGIMMEPKLVYKVIGRNGNIQKQLQPDVYKTAMSYENANILKEMMEAVVLEGTGKNARSGKVGIAGKTGTAEKGSSGSDSSNLAWFVGFAPADDPTLAIAVLIEDVGQGHTGGRSCTAGRKAIEKAVELGY